MDRGLKFPVEWDPGFANLRNALKGTLSVGLTFIAGASLLKATGHPPAIAFLGVVVAFMASVAINDISRRRQQVTLLLLPLAAVIGLGAANWVHHRSPLQFIVLVLFSFVAVWIRGFGPRGVALGMAGFMAYFSAIFFPIPEGAFPWLCVVTLLSTCITFVVRFWLVPAPPAKVLRLYLLAFDARLNRTLLQLEKMLRSAPGDASQIKKLRRRVLQTTEVALGLEQLLNSDDSRSLAPLKNAIKSELFERELSVRKLADVTWRLWAEPGGSRVVLSAAADRIRSADTSLPESSALLQEWYAALTAMRAARAVPLEKAIESRPSPELKIAPFEKVRPNFLIPAIQVSVATALATYLGMQLSPQRWYWAAITAFVVFAGATRGEIVARAGSRIGGTVVGLVLGFLVVLAVAPYKNLEVAILFLCVFCGIYTLRAAFGFWSAAWLTGMLAFLFDLTGQLNFHTLVLRLEETAIGAIVGGIIASLLLPKSTRGMVRRSLAEVLRMLSTLLNEAAQEGAESKDKLVRQLRTLEERVRDLNVAAAPLAGHFTPKKAEQVAGVLYDVSVMVHYVWYVTGSKNEMSPTERTHLKTVAASLQTEADRIQSLQQKRLQHYQRTVSRSAFSDGYSHWLARIEQALKDLHERVPD